MDIQDSHLQDCLILFETDRHDSYLYDLSDPFRERRTEELPPRPVWSFPRKLDVTVTSEPCLVLFELDRQDQTLSRPLHSSSKGHSISSSLRFSLKGITHLKSSLFLYEDAKHHQSSLIPCKDIGYLSVHFVPSGSPKPAQKSQNKMRTRLNCPQTNHKHYHVP